MKFPLEIGSISMREIGNPYRLIIFLYAASVLAVILLLDSFGFSSSEMIAVASFLAIAGATLMLWNLLRANAG